MPGSALLRNLLPSARRPPHRRARLPAAAEEGMNPHRPAASRHRQALASIPMGQGTWPRCGNAVRFLPAHPRAGPANTTVSTISIYPLRVSAASSRLPARGEICLKSITFSACLNLRDVYGCMERETLPADTMCPQDHCRWALLGMETRRHSHLNGTL